MKSYNYLENYLFEIQGEGKKYFTISSLKEKFKDYSQNAIQMNLKRLNKKQKIKHIMKGFYVIVPPEYQSRKILPPEFFIDALFKYLKRPYYMGLLSASVFHNATHQQAMEYYVFVNKPSIRATSIEGLKINYVLKQKLPEYGLIKIKTETGYLRISNAELTAVDLIEYQHRIGGLNRAATVLYELTESMSVEHLKEVLKNDISLSVLQRTGYIFERILHRKELADVIRNFLEDKKIFRVPLKSERQEKGFPTDPQWSIIENQKIETDFT